MCEIEALGHIHLHRIPLGQRCQMESSLNQFQNRRGVRPPCAKHDVSSSGRHHNKWNPIAGVHKVTGGSSNALVANITWQKILSTSIHRSLLFRCKTFFVGGDSTNDYAGSETFLKTSNFLFLVPAPPG